MTTTTAPLSSTRPPYSAMDLRRMRTWIASEGGDGDMSLASTVECVEMHYAGGVVALLSPRPLSALPPVVGTRQQWTVTAPGGRHSLTAVGVVVSLRDAGVESPSEDFTPLRYSGCLVWILTSRLSALPLPSGL